MILVKYKRAHGLSMVKNQGEVSERLKVQSWKGCVGATPPWVRIPPSLN